MVSANWILVAAAACGVLAADPIDAVNKLAVESHDTIRGIEALNNDLRASDGSPSPQQVCKYATNLGSQIQSCIEAAEQNADVNHAIISSIISPAIDTAVDGVEHLCACLANTDVDDDVTANLHTLSSTLNHCAATAGKFDMKEQEHKIQSLASKVHAFAHQDDHDLSARQMDVFGAMGGAVHNLQQRIDSVVNDMMKKNSRPGASIGAALITGLDGQVDNVLALIANTLRPLTGGLSDLVMGFILGPVFQSITDGVEVVLGNAVGSVLDIVLIPASRLLQHNVVKLASVANEYKMAKYASKFQQQSQQLQQLISNTESQNKQGGHSHGTNKKQPARQNNKPGARF